MQSYRLRPHHGLCTAFFIGEGYSSEFTENMAECIAKLDDYGPNVILTVGTDIICEKCPNNAGGHCCDSKPEIYDRRVLEITGIPENTELDWHSFRDKIRKDIITAGRLGEVCSSCKWYSICNTENKTDK